MLLHRDLPHIGLSDGRDAFRVTGSAILQQQRKSDRVFVRWTRIKRPSRRGYARNE